MVDRNPQKTPPFSAEAAKTKTVEALSWIGYVGLDSTIDPWEMLYGQHFWVQAARRFFLGYNARMLNI